MGLDERIIVQQMDEEDRFMSPEFVERLLDTLPLIKPHDPSKPEWRATPHIPLDLRAYGFDIQLHVKDESDLRSNLNGTHKSRKAHELGPVAFRAMAENLHQRRVNAVLQTMPVPRFCEIGAGNSAKAQALMNERYGLPAPTVIIGSNLPDDAVEHLKAFHLNIVQVPLGHNIFTGKQNDPYTPKQIRELAGLPQGHDVTSSAFFHRDTDFYDWHVHEAFNHFGKIPGSIYVPAGSEELFAHYVNWQALTARSGILRKDPRLTADPHVVTQLNIFGAEPLDRMDSIADKLRGIKPYSPWKENDVNAAKMFGFTGRGTGVYPVSEGGIILAHNILGDAGIAAEYSGATALGLVIEQYKQGILDTTKPILVINTGKGV